MNLLSVKCVEEWNLGETGFGNATEHQNTVAEKFLWSQSEHTFLY